MKKVFHNIAEESTMHGFREILHANNLWWKSFWTITVIVASVVTAIQTYQTVHEFFSNPTYTSIKPADEDEILYPPVKLCYLHWIYWVDWEKAAKHGFTKAMVLYGLSYHAEIDSFHVFDITNIRTVFLEHMKLQNLSRVSQFYKLIARDLPFVLGSGEQWNEEINTVFSALSFSPLKFQSLCYIANSEHVKKIRNQRDGGATMFSFNMPDQSYESLKNGISESEYNYYIEQYLMTYSAYYGTKDKNGSSAVIEKFALPLQIYPDGYSYFTDISYDNDWYFYKVGMSAYRAMNSACKPCKIKIRSTRGNNTEKLIWQAKYALQVCKCPNLFDAFLVDSDFLEILCPQRIRFIENGSITESEQVNKIKICTPTDIQDAQLENLLNRIQTPCEAWMYTIAEDVSKNNQKLNKFMEKNVTNIFIAYPNPSQVLITTEISAHTWQNFVGSVGGVMGIWTGASLLSFVQLIYIIIDGYSRQRKMHVVDAEKK